MSGTAAKIEARRLVVMLPNWLGDAVMATPFLRALRGVYPGAHIAALARPLAAAVCGGGLVDEVMIFEKGEEGAAAKWMRVGRFELGVLLPNSFRSAWMMWRGGVKRRLGYARGGRSVLLTDRVAARRKTPEQERHDRGVRVAIALLRRQELIEGGELVRMVVEEGRLFPRVFAEYRMEATGHVVRTNALHRRGREYRALREDYQPVPAIEYYLELARHLGAENPSRAMELEVTEAERREAERALAELGVAPAIENQQSKIENIVVLVPGANFGASKCWMPERFAAVAEALADPAGPFGARVVLAGSAGETPICQAIQGAMKGQRQRVAILGSANGGKGVSVGALKAIIRRARLMVGNDTGPRHMAAALGVPAVTLFGPTNPVWAETFSAAERVVRVEVPCGPCQLKVCPIDHRCMRGVTVERVLEAVRGVWGLRN